MPYDLYGTYYASRRDAENAEMAQCAEIDARLASEKVDELERMLYEAQQQNPLDEEIYNLRQKIKELEERIIKLESN